MKKLILLSCLFCISVTSSLLAEISSTLYSCVGQKIYATDLLDPSFPTELFGDYSSQVNIRLEGLAYDPANQFLYAMGHDSVNVYRIDTNTRELIVSAVAGPTGHSLAFNTSTGLLYTANGIYDMFSIDPITGESFHVSDSVSGGGMAYDLNRDLFYASHDKIDIVTVAPDGTPLSSRRFPDQGFRFDGLAYDPVGDMIYAGNYGHVVAISPIDWSYEILIGPPASYVGGLAVATIPEPATLSLLAIGAILLRRRRA